MHKYKQSNNNAWYSLIRKEYPQKLKYKIQWNTSFYTGLHERVRIPFKFCKNALRFFERREGENIKPIFFEIISENKKIMNKCKIPQDESIQFSTKYSQRKI